MIMILCNDFGQNNGHKNWPSWYMRSQRGWWCWKVEVTREPQHWSIGAPGRRQVVKDQHWTNIDPALLLPPPDPALESTFVFLILLLNHLLNFWFCSTLAFLILLLNPLLPLSNSATWWGVWLLESGSAALGMLQILWCDSSKSSETVLVVCGF